jgi:hypothetical protein
MLDGVVGVLLRLAEVLLDLSFQGLRFGLEVLAVVAGDVSGCVANLAFGFLCGTLELVLGAV